MTIFKHVMSGPQNAGDMWTSGLHSFGVSSLATAHAQWQEAVESAFGSSAIGNYWPNATKIRDLVTYAINPATGKATAVRRSSTTVDGIGGTGTPSPRDCVVAGLRTAVPGPGGRGRMYLPGVSLDNLDVNGLIEAAARTAIANGLATAFGFLEANGVQPGLWKLLSTVVIPFTDVTVGVVSGTQRRRTNKIPNSYATAAV